MMYDIHAFVTCCLFMKVRVLFVHEGSHDV